MGHALFSCKYAKTVWKAQKLNFNWQACTAMRNGDYLLHLSSLYNKSEMEQLFCTLWAIWNERNKVVHGSKARVATDLAIFATVFLQNFRNAQHKHPPVAAVPTFSHQSGPSVTAFSHQQQNSIAALHPWSPPAPNVLKLNIDAAVHSPSNTTGVGAVLRDNHGHVVAALAMPFIGNFKSHEMEAKALFHSLNWALQQQLQVNHIETDALMVVNALQAPFNPNSSFSDLILDVVSLLSFFPNVVVSHVKRLANEAAHGLAKFALGVDEACTWLEIIPPPIYSVIVNESLFV
ncbi:uncharacterized protein LOC133031947 [Cannabis sativa]|uniref:uncharacterized protein LOC133031947 n=1 Tax=Cannabis sativa TaxID=3483 RepID=UPI0029CA0972|nr:uncharacterized protein LOC133031947 [Cannabis sativa]